MSVYNLGHAGPKRTKMETRALTFNLCPTLPQSNQLAHLNRTDFSVFCNYTQFPQGHSQRFIKLVCSKGTWHIQVK